MSIIGDFKSINLKLNRLEQKAEADKKAEAVNVGQAWPFTVAVPLVDLSQHLYGDTDDRAATDEAARKSLELFEAHMAVLEHQQASRAEWLGYQKPTRAN